MNQNEHAYAICRRLEVVGDAFSSRNVKTFEGYLGANSEVASSSSFRDLQKKDHFVTAVVA